MKTSAQPQQQKKTSFLLFLGFFVSLLTSAPSCANHYHMGATNHHQGPSPSQGFSPGSSYSHSSNSREARLRQDEIEAYREVELELAKETSFIKKQRLFIQDLKAFVSKKDNTIATAATLDQNSARTEIIEKSRELARLSRSLLFKQKKVTEGHDCLSLADLMLDSALYFNPLTGIGAALYSAFTGKTLSGQSLSDDERASELLTVALISFPFAKAMRIMGSASKFITQPFAVKAGELAHRIATRSEGFEKFVAKPEFTNRLKNYFSLGEEWAVKATRAKKSGEPGIQLMRDRGTHIRFMNGKATSPHEVSRNPYVVMYKDGVKVVDRGVEGHIPFHQLTPDFVKEVLL